MVYDFVSFLKSIITFDLDIKDIYIKPYVMVIPKTIFVVFDAGIASGYLCEYPPINSDDYTENHGPILQTWINFNPSMDK